MLLSPIHNLAVHHFFPKYQIHYCNRSVIYGPKKKKLKEKWVSKKQQEVRLNPWISLKRLSKFYTRVIQFLVYLVQTRISYLNRIIIWIWYFKHSQMVICMYHLCTNVIKHSCPLYLKHTCQKKFITYKHLWSKSY